MTFPSDLNKMDLMSLCWTVRDFVAVNCWRSEVTLTLTCSNCCVLQPTPFSIKSDWKTIWCVLSLRQEVRHGSALGEKYKNYSWKKAESFCTGYKMKEWSYRQTDLCFQFLVHTLMWKLILVSPVVCRLTVMLKPSWLELGLDSCQYSTGRCAILSVYIVEEVRTADLDHPIAETPSVVRLQVQPYETVRVKNVQPFFSRLGNWKTSVPAKTMRRLSWYQYDVNVWG